MRRQIHSLPVALGGLGTDRITPSYMTFGR